MIDAMKPFPFAYFHGPSFHDYNFGGGHAFNPIRQELTLDLVRRAGLLPQEAILLPPVADEDVISLFHSPTYIDTVKKIGAGEPPSLYPPCGIGTGDNPAFRGMHQAAAARVGATLAGARGVMEGRSEHAVNFGGGLHHAHARRASGFCIYNDICVAIAWLRENLDCKVAYVDLDAHHGDGVQWGFYDDPDVLTLSIHESGKYLFPGSGGADEIGEGAGKGSSINIPLLPHTDSESWLQSLEIVLADVITSFKPDVIITQHGCDAHRLDPLTHLSVSSMALSEATDRLHHLAHDVCGGRWIALGGGGYSVWHVVPRAWGLVWAAVTDQSVSDTLPVEWVKVWQRQAPIELPTRWHEIEDNPPIKDAADVEAEWRRQQNEKTARAVRQTALSYLRKRTR